MVSIDVAIFEQALFNLLDNAAKYAPRGSLVRIRGYGAERSVAIEVEDEGPGIPPEQLERIFEKFHRASEGDNRPAGTGLGLSICRGFVEGLGGRIAAVNRTDRSGARFTIKLPVPESASAEAVTAPVV